MWSESSIYEGTFPGTFCEMYLEYTGPAIIAEGSPIIIPKNMTHPKSAPRIPATAIGPGVGGINACVTAKPANNGKA